VGEESGDLFEQIWKLYIDPIKPRIRSRAMEIAKADDRSEITAVDVFEALKEFVPGKAVPLTPQSQSWFRTTFTGFTGVAGIMALAFGILGIIPFFGLVSAQSAYASVASGFLEVAKIFAGAMVGGAASKRGA
jgi:hypothetical protein